MKIKSIIYKFIGKIIRIEIINTSLRQLIKPFSQIIPKNVIRSIPVVGKIYLKLTDSKKLYLKSDEDSIAQILYWWGMEGFEHNSIQLFIKLLKHADTVFDIGANTGIYALIAAIDNSHRTVYAFEPVPRVFDLLKNNVEINKLNNLQIFPNAITNHDGNVILYIPSDNIPVSASTLQGFRNVSETISVPALTIDSFVAMNSIPKVDLIKIDTEATEHMVLEGAKNLLKRDEPIIICEVLKGRTEKYLHSILDNLQYKYYWISDEGLIEKEQIEGDGTYKNSNYLFITKKKKRVVMKEITV